MTARCNLTDTVLARHLDGDLDAHAASWMSAEALAEHARDCPSCQRELQAARRLDAALAETSGRQCAAGPALEVRLQRLLQRAVAAATAPARPLAPPANKHPWLLLGLAAGLLLGVGIAIGRSMAGSSPVPPKQLPIVEPDAAGGADRRAASAANGEDSGSPASAGIPAGALPLPRSIAALVRVGPSSPARVSAWAAVLANGANANPVGPTCADPPVDELAPGPTELRLRASRSLLEAGTEAALQAWVDALTKISDQQLRSAVLAEARNRAGLLAYLRRRLGSAPPQSLDLLATVAVAAQLGHRDLDATLRQRIRRQRDLHLELAAALRSADRPAGAAKLLLDVFGDLVARGAAADDETTARSLFQGQPPRVGAELVDELQSSGETPRRVRALLALGISADVGMRPILLSWMRATGRDEALAAAFAIAMLPTSALEDLAEQATVEPRMWLLRTALLRARVPVARIWLDELALTAEERALLQSPFSYHQLPIVAACFRERLGAPQ